MATTSANICPVDIISKPAWRQEMTKKSEGLYMRMYLQWQNQDMMNVIFSFKANWLIKWLEFSGPTIERRKAETEQSP